VNFCCRYRLQPLSNINAYGKKCGRQQTPLSVLFNEFSPQIAGEEIGQGIAKAITPTRPEP
jgi:hypothetical protein